jgi:hypothetical protein
MPFSWIRVPNHESEQVRAMIGSDYSRQQFVDAVTQFISDGGGTNVQIAYELNGKYTRVCFYWEAGDWLRKERIVLKLEGEPMIDLLSVEEANQLHQD